MDRTKDGRDILGRSAIFVVFIGIAVGGIARLTDQTGLSEVAWAFTVGIALIPLSITVGRDLVRGHVAVDLIALLAMAGSLLLGEYLAGAVIALMLSGGNALESYASARAKEDLSALMDRAPKNANRYERDTLTLIDVSDVIPGDRLLVKPGEIVPVDGAVSQRAVLDASTLTGESLPVELDAGDPVRSGTVNAGGPFDMIASASSADSTYSAIVGSVRQARSSKGPFVRMADRYALIFLPITLIAAATAWVVSSDPIRALAVLVVATPCPLILAAPVAMVSGISRAARRGAVMKGSAAFEALGRSQILLMDKTGTLTEGSPTVSGIDAQGMEPTELLRLAASLDQVSHHPYATAIVKAAMGRGLNLSFPSDTQERFGAGIEGMVEGHRIRVGKGEWVFDGKLPPPLRQIRRRATLEGRVNVFVKDVGKGEGALLLDDPLRPDAPRTIRLLRKAGISRVILVTGDHYDIAENIGSAVGVDHILAERSPSEKAEAVVDEGMNGRTVMVGDGINDAPALAVAGVGVALGARGASAHSDAADVILTVDRLDGLAEAMSISQRSRRIALQSVIAGMVLSVVAMALAAAGLVTPVAGALIQEGIDVAVILNALRALGDGRGRRHRTDPELGERLRFQHRSLLPDVDTLRSVADRLEDMDASTLLAELRTLRSFLTDRLLPHEEEEEKVFYPTVAAIIGGDDPTGNMVRAHREIRHLGRLFIQITDDIPASGPHPSDIADLRRILYGLHAILRLHFAQEDESYLSLEEFSSR